MTYLLIAFIPVIILLIVAFALREKREYEHVEAVAFGRAKKDGLFKVLMDNPDYRGHYRFCLEAKRQAQKKVVYGTLPSPGVTPGK